MAVLSYAGELSADASVSDATFAAVAEFLNSEEIVELTLVIGFGTAALLVAAIALALVVPLSIASYFLPTLLSLAALGNWQEWHTRYFSDAALLIGGRWLGFWMTMAAMVANISLFNATVLTTTRMPSAMSEDGYLPPALSSKHPHFGTPWIAIVISSVVYALLAFQTLVQLITVYMWLRIATTVLTVLAGWRMRKTHPELPRPFRIPWGRSGLFYVVAAPLAMSCVAMLGSDSFGLRWGPPALLLGPVAYVVLRWTRGAGTMKA